MSIRFFDRLFLPISFALLVILYWPSLNGFPIWDDVSYFFADPVITKPFSYLDIWKNFAWPMSVTFQKISYSLFGTKFYAYHLVSLLLHFINSILLLNLAGKFNLPYRRAFFLLFLLHPSNVITVAWMIQVKTLLCFFFAVLSIWAFEKGLVHRKWIVLSWILFLFSMYSKTASFPLPFLFLFWSWKKLQRKELLWVLPFFLISLAGGYRLLSSSVTTQAVKNLPTFDKPAPIAAEPSKAEKKIDQPVVTAPTTQPIPTPAPAESKWLIRAELFLKTNSYYFWQTVIPLQNQPVKGINDLKPLPMDYIHIIFIALLMAINFKSIALYPLLAGHLLLLPFMGLVDAPYMNLTLVSDQHIYLALPFFIMFWLMTLSRWKFKYARLTPIPIILFFCYQVARTTPYYKDEIPFYLACLEADPLNVPMTYNLATSYIQRGNANEAMNVLTSAFQLTEIAPEMKKNKYFIYLVALQLEIQRALDGK